MINFKYETNEGMKTTTMIKSNSKIFQLKQQLSLNHAHVNNDNMRNRFSSQLIFKMTWNTLNNLNPSVADFFEAICRAVLSKYA